jgi:hypothetical protein
MTKLEQCVRMAVAIDLQAKIHIGFEGDEFYVDASRSSTERGLAFGSGKTLDDAIDAMHAKLSERLKPIRAALSNFEAPKS